MQVASWEGAPVLVDAFIFETLCICADPLFWKLIAQKSEFSGQTY